LGQKHKYNGEQYRRAFDFHSVLLSAKRRKAAFFFYYLFVSRDEIPSILNVTRNAERVNNNFNYFVKLGVSNSLCAGRDGGDCVRYGQNTRPPSAATLFSKEGFVGCDALPPPLGEVARAA
jgi:hypothetical protein